MADKYQVIFQQNWKNKFHRFVVGKLLLLNSLIHV